MSNDYYFRLIKLIMIIININLDLCKYMVFWRVRTYKNITSVILCQEGLQNNF